MDQNIATGLGSCADFGRTTGKTRKSLVSLLRSGRPLAWPGNQTMLGDRAACCCCRRCVCVRARADPNPAKAAAHRQPLSTRSQTFDNTNRTQAAKHGKITRSHVFAEPEPEVHHVIRPEARMDVERHDVVVEDEYEFDEADMPDSDEMEDDDDEFDDEDWLRLSPGTDLAARQEIQAVKDTFQDDIDLFDTTMVAEYADEIFAHMEELEVRFHVPHRRLTCAAGYHAEPAVYGVPD